MPPCGSSRQAAALLRLLPGPGVSWTQGNRLLRLLPGRVVDPTERTCRLAAQLLARYLVAPRGA